MADRLPIPPDRAQPPPDGAAMLALHVALPGLHLCIALKHVCRVLAMMALQEVPAAPPHFVGLLNLGGDVVPVIDLGCYLKRPPFVWRADTPVVLCDADGKCCGFLVENVLGALSWPNLLANPNAPRSIARSTNGATCAISCRIRSIRPCSRV